MKEGSRFLRYVIPGLIMLVELAIYLYLSDKDFLISKIENHINGLEVPLTIFLASGGIGFLLGVIYHFLFWWTGLRRWNLDHRGVIDNCYARGWLKVRMRADGSDVDPSEIKQRGAWRVVTSFWHVRIESSPRIKTANVFTDDMGDIVHGLGTSLVGSFFALVTWVFVRFFIVRIHYSSQYRLLDWLWLIIPVSMIIIHFLNYREMVSNFQGIIDSIFANEVKIESTSVPVVIELDKNDLKKQQQQKKKKERTDNQGAQPTKNK